MTFSREFFSGLIDYAGLFPPAGLDLREAVEQYNGYLAGSDRPALGTFVIPALQLPEIAPLIEAASDSGWQLSVIGGPDPTLTLAAIKQFDQLFAARGSAPHARCVAVEMPVVSADEVERAIAEIPPTIELYLEVPTRTDPGSLVQAISATRARAKVRTGGIVSDAFPAAEALLDVLAACRHFLVPLKATAGLHHAITGTYPLTYAADAAKARMFGYLNVFLASAFLAKDESGTALGVLEEEDPRSFQFGDTDINWRGSTVTWQELIDTRGMTTSFGSCSFTEPIAEARELGLI